MCESFRYTIRIGIPVSLLTRIYRLRCEMIIIYDCFLQRFTQCHIYYMYCTFVGVIKTLRKTLKLIQKFHQSSSCFCFSINSAKYDGNQYIHLCADFLYNCKTTLRYLLEDHHIDYLRDSCYKILCKLNRKDNDCRAKINST